VFLWEILTSISKKEGGKLEHRKECVISDIVRVGRRQGERILILSIIGQIK
jgi:hypothetical protein